MGTSHGGARSDRPKPQILPGCQGGAAMTLTRRTLLAGALAAKPKKTNVVMIMTDDHGAWTLGSYGCSEAYTPNLDQLAKEGARFTRAYACTPVCSPSRMSYMTGKIPSRHGVQ